MTREELLAQMEKLVEAGDTKALETFALEHFKEFPEEVQSKLLFSFFNETLEKEAGDAQITEIQRQGLDALEKFSKAEPTQE